VSKRNHDFEEKPAVIDLQAVTVSYGSRAALDGLSLQVPHGAQVAVVGPNGAGKSTLFKALVGLLPLSGGDIRIHGLPLRSHDDCVAYVPQREEVDWRFPVTVQDVVMMGRYGKQGVLRSLRRPSRADHEIVLRSLAQMGLSDLKDRSISDLSGGQQQRVFLARALAQEPHILLMDEPFTGVDVSTQEATLALLDGLRQAHVTVMVSTHDLSMAAERFEYVLLLNRRAIAFGSPAQVFTAGHIRAAFGSQVLNIEGALVVDECCPPDESRLEHEAHG
jgi:ABC-type Mn2+/Zn2+ transport system ATPase subunit